MVNGRSNKNNKNMHLLHISKRTVAFMILYLQFVSIRQSQVVWYPCFEKEKQSWIAHVLFVNNKSSENKSSFFRIYFSIKIESIAGSDRHTENIHTSGRSYLNKINSKDFRNIMFIWFMFSVDNTYCCNVYLCLLANKFNSIPEPLGDS